MILVYDYGVGNIGSISNVLSKLGFNHTVSNKTKDLLDADKVIFPGIGNFRYVMNKLQKKKNIINSYLRETDKPVLGICIGMHILSNFSEEFHSHKGLGVFNIEVKKIVSNKFKIPNIGFKKINILNRDLNLFNGINNINKFYFLHSYAIKYNTNYTIASFDFEKKYSAIIKKKNIYGCQFHPEKSGNYGEKFLFNFCKL